MTTIDINALKKNDYSKAPIHSLLYKSKPYTLLLNSATQWPNMHYLFGLIPILSYDTSCACYKHQEQIIPIPGSQALSTVHYQLTTLETCTLLPYTV